MSVDKNIHPEFTSKTPLFGYFCVEENGLETILVQIDSDERWAFPINTEFDPHISTINQAIDMAVLNCCEHSKVLDRKDLLASGLDAPVICSVLIGPSSSQPSPVSEEVIPGIFFKIRLKEQTQPSKPGYAWRAKHTLFAKKPNNTCLTRLTREQLDALHLDYKYTRFGFKILECVDVLAFRVRDGQVEFLMLRRDDKKLGMVGWEYPKGGIHYHHTLCEGALSELAEETGSTSYEYRGYLGCQTVDVSDRKRADYDTLRVHGLTFLFTGKAETLNPSSEGRKEGLRKPTWMSWEEAREKVWMKTYGPEFFDKWKAKKDQILAGLL